MKKNSKNLSCKNTKQLVSIIIVTYNNQTVIEACLLALQKQTYKNLQIIVVDNCSQDETVACLTKFTKDIKLIKAKANSGFTGGNILGMQYARGELIVLLNPDTEPSPVWLEKLAAGMEQNDRIGICASKLIVYGTNLIDSAGDGITTTGRGYKRGEGCLASEYSHNEYVGGACGGAMMLRRKMIAEIGFLDDDFFLIHEDTDLNFRALLTGWKCFFVNEAIVYHKVRSSIGVMSDLAVYYSIRNSRFVWLKNMPLLLMLKYFHQIIMQEIGSFIYFCLRCHKWRAYYRANIDSCKLLRKMLAKRKKVQKLTLISSAETENKLRSLFDHDFLRSKLRKIIKI